jgi:hypothetical protein
MGNLAAETMARRRLVWPDVCGPWLPVWLPNLVSNAKVRGAGEQWPHARHRPL